MTRLFLDTEWADAGGKQLVSLALVDAAGRNRYYCEIDPLPLGPTAFVRDTVYPLLQGGSWAKPASKFTLSLRNFIARQQAPCLILADHPTDFSLLCYALAGFDSKIPGPIPDWTPIEVTQGDVLGHRDLYFDHRPDARARRHHAGVDAEALRWAFEYVIEGAME